MGEIFMALYTKKKRCATLKYYSVRITRLVTQDLKFVFMCTVYISRQWIYHWVCVFKCDYFISSDV